MSLNINCLYGISEVPWDFGEIEDYLKHDSAFINEPNNEGKTPLVVALMDMACKYDVIKILIKYKADVNVEYIGGHTPLTIALQHGRDEDVIALLLQNRANVHHVRNRRSVICVALYHGAGKNVIELLLNAGCPMNNCLKHFSSLFCAVAMTVKKDVPQLLIKRGADRNVVNEHGNSVFCEALAHQLTESSLRKLVEAGVSLKSCVNHSSPFFCAIERGFFQQCFGRSLTRSLVEMLFLKDSFNKHLLAGLTDFQLALRHCKCNANAMRLILERFTDMAKLSSLKNNFLHLALQNWFFFNPIILKILISQGVCVTRANNTGMTALHMAAYNRHCSWEVIDILLRNGAKLNVKNNSGETPLELALKYSPDFKKVRFILAAGPHIGIVERGQSLLKRVLDESDADEHFHPFFQDYFKILLQYQALKNPDFNIDSVIGGHRDYETFLEFWEESVVEVRRMAYVSVGENCTLQDFLNDYFPPSYEAADSESLGEKYNWTQLINIRANSMFPLFNNIIVDKVDRRSMEKIIPKIPMYTNNYCAETSQEEKTTLNFDSVLKISQYLCDEDLLALTVALSFTNSDRSAKTNRDRQSRIASGCDREKFMRVN